LFLLFDAWYVDHEEPFEPGAHFFLLTQGIKANDEVEADVEVWGVVHDVFIHLDGLAEALLLDQGESHILLDLQLHLFVLLGGAVDGHVVVLDGFVVLLLFEKDVAHVHTQAGGLRVLFVFQYNRVAVDSLLVKSVCVIHICQVVENVECQIDVDLVKTAGLLSQRADLFFFCSSFFGLLKGFIVVFCHFGGCRVLKKTVHLFFELLEMLLFRLVLFILNDSLAAVICGDALGNGLTFKASRCVRFHGGAETLGSAWNLGARADGASLV